MIKFNDDIDTHSDGSHRRRKNKNTFSWSSTSSTYSTALSTTTHEDLDEEEEDVNQMLGYLLLQQQQDLNERKLSEILCRAASHGDIQTIRYILMDERLRPYLNVDASDDDENETTPLIYASCFGKLDIVKYLLEVGAKVDIQDKSKRSLTDMIGSDWLTHVCMYSWLDCTHVGYKQWS
jgi:ankyrin repeat protein